MSHYTEDAKKFKFPPMVGEREKKAFVVGYMKEAAEYGLTYEQTIKLAEINPTHAALLSALLGGGVGATTGYMAGDKKNKLNSALLGGGIGAGVGGLGGYYGSNFLNDAAKNTHQQLGALQDKTYSDVAGDGFVPGVSDETINAWRAQQAQDELGLQADRARRAFNSNPPPTQALRTPGLKSLL